MTRLYSAVSELVEELRKDNPDGAKTAELFCGVKKVYGDTCNGISAAIKSE